MQECHVCCFVLFACPTFTRARWDQKLGLAFNKLHSGYNARQPPAAPTTSRREPRSGRGVGFHRLVHRGKQETLELRDVALEMPALVA